MMQRFLRRVLPVLVTLCSVALPLAAQNGAVLRDCNQHLYDPVSFLFRTERFGGEVGRLIERDRRLRSAIQLSPGQDLTDVVYAAQLLERVPNCPEPVVQVVAGNQAPGMGGSTPPGTTGFTVIIKGMPKLQCEMVNLAERLQIRRGAFAVRFEPPGNPGAWQLGECASNPIASLLNLGRPLPQPNTAYLFFSVDLPWCDLTALLASVPDSRQKSDLEDRFLRMAGALSELAAYRESFLKEGVMKDSIDLFPAAYYHITRRELERIRNQEYKYPDAKLRQLIAFYDAYKHNREAHDHGMPVEPHWQRHFDKVEEVQKSVFNVLSISVTKNGLQEIIDTGMQAHIIFDFPRALRFAFDSLGNQGPSWRDLTPDFVATENLFSDAMSETMADIAESNWSGFVAVDIELFFANALAFVTESVRYLLSPEDNLALSPSSANVDYIKAVRLLSWNRAQQGPPWPWPLEKQSVSPAKEMRAKGEAYCAAR
jgi:hypothetical protein